MYHLAGRQSTEAKAKWLEQDASGCIRTLVTGMGGVGKSGVSSSKEHMMTNAHLKTVIHGGERDGSCHLLIRLECWRREEKKKRGMGL